MQGIMCTVGRVVTGAHGRVVVLVVRLRSDRGDSPVPSSIIIAGLAVLALGLVAMMYIAINDFWDQVPSGGQLPNPAPGE